MKGVSGQPFSDQWTSGAVTSTKNPHVTPLAEHQPIVERENDSSQTIIFPLFQIMILSLLFCCTYQLSAEENKKLTHE